MNAEPLLPTDVSSTQNTQGEPPEERHDPGDMEEVHCNDPFLQWSVHELSSLMRPTAIRPQPSTSTSGVSVIRIGQHEIEIVWGFAVVVKGVEKILRHYTSQEWNLRTAIPEVVFPYPRDHAVRKKFATSKMELRIHVWAQGSTAFPGTYQLYSRVSTTYSALSGTTPKCVN